MLRTLAVSAFVLIPLSACDSGSKTAPSDPAPAATPAAKPPEKPAEKPAPSAAAKTPDAPAAKPPAAPAAAAAEKPAEKPAPPTVADTTTAKQDAADPVAAIKAFIASKSIDTKKTNWKTTLPQPPKVAFDESKKYVWVLTTSEGPIRVLLNPKIAPMHVSSTIYLTELGFYDGLAFHRVIPGFMAQGGCPLGNGMGSPGYKYGGEFAPGVSHDRPGLLSMANAGAGTDGSQFFLTFVPTQGLDGKHTIFGEVTDGMDTLKTLESFGSKPAGTTKKPLSIQSAKIAVE